MKKSKVAIAIDKGLLDMVDSSIDGASITSRSQAIGVFLRRGVPEFLVSTAIILISRKHQPLMFSSINGKTLAVRQLEFFKKNGIKEVAIFTQKSEMTGRIKKELSKVKVKTTLMEKEAKGTAEAVKLAAKNINSSFIVAGGDILADFDLKAMIRKHIKSDRLATMGLMSREKPMQYGSVTLDDDLVVEFKEKSKTANSYVVNAGIYCFKPEALELIDKDTISLEKDLFPKLARIKQLIGFFMFGEYAHVK